MPRKWTNSGGGAGSRHDGSHAWTPPSPFRMAGPDGPVDLRVFDDILRANAKIDGNDEKRRSRGH